MTTTTSVEGSFMQHINFYEKCKELLDKLSQQASVDSTVLADSYKHLGQELYSTEQQLKNSINWKRLGSGISDLRHSAKLTSYKLPHFAWVVILAILWALNFVALKKLHMTEQAWISLAISIITTGGLFYALYSKHVYGLQNNINVYLMRFKGKEQGEMPYKFTSRGIFGFGKNAPELMNSNWSFSAIDEPFNEYMIGFFRNSDCIGYLAEDGNGWKFSDFSKTISIGKDVCSDKIRQLIAHEGTAIDKLQITVEKIQRINDLQNNPLKIDRVKQCWSDIVLNTSELDELAQALVAFSCNTKSAPRGILLKGPPGTGKSITACAFAESSGAHFIKLSASDIKSKWIGESGGKVKDIWDEARSNVPSIIFIDECEGVFAKRGSENSDAMTNEMVQNFLTQWDGISQGSRVLIIGATNRADILDDAIISRFTDIIELVPVDAANRPRIIAAVAKQAGITADVPLEILNAFGGMSGREIRNVMEKAGRIAMSDAPSTQHFEEAIAKVRGKSSTKVAIDATWETLILPDALINRLKAMCQMVRDSEILVSKGIPVPKTLLLYGPPGTGKTQIARTLANEAGINFVAFTTADLKGQYLGQAANRVKQAFESARASSPSIIFIDEIDALTQSRGANSDALQTEAITQLLQELDGVSSKSGDVLVIAATNLLDQIDAAILSRFAQRLEIGLPSTAEKAAILSTLLKGKPISLHMSMTHLAEKCDGYSGRELRELVSTAFNFAVERVIAAGESVQNTELTDVDIENALA